MHQGTEAEISRILSGAELWMRLDRPAAGDPGAPQGDASGTAPAPDGPLVLIAGWEDGFPACAPFVAGDGGEDCRGCPVGLVANVLRTRRALVDRCPSGIRLLAFPAPAFATDSAAVLRLDHDLGDGDAVPEGAAVLGAARRLRRRSGLAAWQAEQRARGA